MQEQQQVGLFLMLRLLEGDLVEEYLQILPEIKVLFCFGCVPEGDSGGLINCRGISTAFTSAPGYTGFTGFDAGGILMGCGDADFSAVEELGTG